VGLSGEPHGACLLFWEAVCGTMGATTLAARRPSAGAVPGRCECCLAADTHRPLFSARAEPTYSVPLTAEAVVVAGGGVVVADAGQAIHKKRSQVVHAAADTFAARTTNGPVAGDGRTADGHRAVGDIDPATLAVAVVSTDRPVAADEAIGDRGGTSSDM